MGKDFERAFANTLSRVLVNKYERKQRLDYIDEAAMAKLEATRKVEQKIADYKMQEMEDKGYELLGYEPTQAGVMIPHIGDKHDKLAAELAREKVTYEVDKLEKQNKLLDQQIESENNRYNRFLNKDKKLIDEIIGKAEERDYDNEDLKDELRGLKITNPDSLDYAFNKFSLSKRRPKKLSEATINKLRDDIKDIASNASLSGVPYNDYINDLERSGLLKNKELKGYAISAYKQQAGLFN